MRNDTTQDVKGNKLRERHEAKQREQRLTQDIIARSLGLAPSARANLAGQILATVEIDGRTLHAFRDGLDLDEPEEFAESLSRVMGAD